MKASIIASLLLGCSAAAEAQSSEQEPKPPSAPTTPPSPVTVVNSQEVRFVGTLDMEEMSLDPQRAAHLLRLLDGIAAQSAEGSVQRGYADALRATTLATLGRRSESLSLIDRILESRSLHPPAYPGAWVAAALLADTERMVAVMQAAQRNIPAAYQHGLRHGFEVRVARILQMLGQPGHDSQWRAAVEALARVGWPGDHDPDRRDDLRISLLDLRLAAGDAAGAAELARRIAAPGPLLRLLAIRRYDPLLPAIEDRSGRFAEALAAHDRLTAAIVARGRDYPDFLASRVALLMSAGRYEEALALLRPYTADIAATISVQLQARTLVEPPAYALLALGRDEESADLFARFVAFTPEMRADLLDAHINYASFLWSAGRSREAKAHAEHLLQRYDPHMSDLGRVWTWSALACAEAELGNAAQARVWIDRMRGIVAGGGVPMMRSLLCLGEMESAEAFMIERLRGEQPDLAILAVQNWRLAELSTGPLAAVERRMAELARRPAVVEALNRVGRVLDLPLNRSYWGSY